MLSKGVELEAVVGELLLEQPSAQVEHYFDGQRGVLEVQMSLVHLLKYVREDIVHQQGEACRTACLAEFVVSLQFDYTVSQVNNELKEKFLGVLTQLIFQLQQELSKGVVNGSGIGVVDLVLVLLLMLLPVLLDVSEVHLILFADIPHLLVSLFVLQREWEKLVQVFSQSLDILQVLKPVNFFLVLFLYLVFLVFLGNSNFVVLCFPVVLSLDMGVKSRVAEV